MTAFLSVRGQDTWSQGQRCKNSRQQYKRTTTATVSVSTLGSSSGSSSSSNTENDSSIHQDENGNCVFGLKSFWDDMYTGEGDSNRPADKYSWYCGWDELSPFWEMLVPLDSSAARVLIAGIGNDKTPIDMYDAGWNSSMTAFDYSSAGVERARELFGSHRNNVQLLTADARDLPLADSSVDATLDKGTLDAIYITGEEIFRDSVKELTRVTATNGVVVCVSRVIYPEELMGAFESGHWENILNGELAFAPDGEATIDLGAELYAWRRNDVKAYQEK